MKVKLIAEYGLIEECDHNETRCDDDNADVPRRERYECTGRVKARLQHQCRRLFHRTYIIRFPREKK